MDFSSLYNNCRLCPKSCGVDRTAGEKGYCGEGADLRLAFAGLHRGEEPPLSGQKGSGTVFVSGCNLRCVICQNWQISSGGGSNDGRAGKCLGRAVSTEEFAEICLALQNKGAENINIVTGSHAVPAVVSGLTAAKTSGLKIPVLWNSSGYETPETLDLLNGLVDTWLPDLKTLDDTLASRLFNTPDYPDVAAAAILWMIKNRPQRPAGGVIIRHLILPGFLESTRSVLRWFAENAAGKALLSLMSQYTPMAETDRHGRLSRPSGLDRPGRFLSKREYETVLGWLEEFGIEDGFCQDYVTGSDWLPDFTLSNPFSSELSVPVWHYQYEHIP